MTQRRYILKNVLCFFQNHYSLIGYDVHIQCVYTLALKHVYTHVCALILGREIFVMLVIDVYVYIYLYILYTCACIRSYIDVL